MENNNNVNNNFNHDINNSVNTNIDNKKYLVCNKCGTAILNSNISFCPNCGNNFIKNLNNNINNNSTPSATQYNSVESQYNLDSNNKTNKSSVVLLIISFINLIIIAPIVIRFLIIWLLFGAAFSNNEILYYGILLCGCGYILSSITSLIAFIINQITKGKSLKKCLLAIFISFCLGFIAPIILHNSNYSPSKSQMENNTLTSDKIIFENNDLKIIQKKINYDKYDVKLYFDLQTSKISNYSLPIFLSVRVNHCIISSAMLKKDESNSEPNLYYLSISYSDLNRYNIKDIYMIDFDIQNKKENNNINIKFELNSNKKDMIKVIGLNSDELIYENNYFKLYFDSNYSSSTGKFYIQSLISSKYTLSISNADFDTKGYVNDNFKEIKLYENSITFNEISFHPCNENMHYIKFNYIIRDENYEKIKTEHVELTFQKAKIDTKYCLNNTN